MPTLNWIGKDAVVRHHKEVPFRLLEPVPELSCGDAASGNLIVQGDNLHALKALLPRYAGQVKCIYIDPPYNTGNEGWVYNDNVNSAEIRRWLGEVVGKEGETLDRHDRWLCMMYPRLVLLKQFLREDGAIFVSIDDNEVGNLQALMREVFGSANKALLMERKVKWRRRKPGIDEVLSFYDSLRSKHGDDHAALRKEMMAWYRALAKSDPRKAHKHYTGQTSAACTSPLTSLDQTMAVRAGLVTRFLTPLHGNPVRCPRRVGAGRRTQPRQRWPTIRHASISARITRPSPTARATCAKSMKSRC